MRRLLRQCPWPWILSSVIAEARNFSKMQKRKCKYRSLEAGRIEQVRIFTLLSRTEAVVMFAV